MVSYSNSPQSFWSVFQEPLRRNEFEDYIATFEAGRFTSELIGPFLVQVIVWKCQSKVHRDSGDGKDGKGSWCTIFNTGKYTGGFFYLPDLKIRLA